MASKGSFKLEWIIIIVLGLLLIGGSIFFVTRIKEVNKSADNQQKMDTKSYKKLVQFEELEKAYAKALKEIDESVNAEDANLEILKQNLSNILNDIKKKKDDIMLNKNGEDTLNTDQLKDMLDASKDVLSERLAQLQKENAELVKTNQILMTSNEKLEVQLGKASKYIEVEKIKNTKLNEMITSINSEIKQLESEKKQSSSELKELKKRKDEYEEKLQESNKIIKTQTTQISELGAVLRKVNIESFFVYEEGNKEEQAKIYLTSDGLSNKYLKYFITKNLQIHFLFSINEEIYKDGPEKVDFKIFNSSSNEIFGISRTITGKILDIAVPNKLFKAGAYVIELRSGAEDLIIGGKFRFKI